MSSARLSRTRLTVAVVAALTTATAIAASSAHAAVPIRSGCGLVTDPTGDTAADPAGTGAPGTVPQMDAGLDISAIDVASDANWIGARVHVKQLPLQAATTGGEAFEVEMTVGGGTLILGVGRYGNMAGLTGDQKFAYAGFQKGTVGARDISAYDVRMSVDAATSTMTVLASRQALKEIGADISGYALNVNGFSGRDYGNMYTVGYDTASGSKPYKIGAPSCVALPH